MLLLLVQMMPFVCTTALYLYQYRLKQTALQRLRHEHIICLQLPANATISAGDEVRMNGMMMDVKSVVNQTNQTLVYAWPDAEEESLQQELDTIASQQPDKNNNKEILGKALKIFLLDFYHPPVLQATLSSNLLVAASYFSFSTSLATVYLPVFTPPPIVAFFA
jgi:hypothetical protein